MSKMPLVQSVDRAISILELLSREGPTSVTEVAQELDVHKSTAYRLLATLAQRSLVEQDQATEKYGLGNGLTELAQAVHHDPDILAAAKPVCQYLCGQLGQTVTVSVLEGEDAVVIHQSLPSNSVLTVDWTGTRGPIHATAAGKVLLAYLPSGRRKHLLREPLRATTEQTMTELTEIERQLLEVWESGYAVSVDELEEGLKAVAAPIKDARGRVLAALSVSGPSFRMGEGELDEIGRQTADAANQISRTLGFR